MKNRAKNNAGWLTRLAELFSRISLVISGLTIAAFFLAPQAQDVLRCWHSRPQMPEGDV